MIAFECGSTWSSRLNSLNSTKQKKGGGYTDNKGRIMYILLYMEFLRETENKGY